MKYGPEAPKDKFAATFLL